MKVLVLHNKYKVQGGEDVSTEAEITLLKKNGIEVHSMIIDNKNIEHENKIKLAINTVWSTKFYKEVSQKIKTEKYDIVHIQNFFPLFSPSIFYAAKKAGAKVIMTVRNYRLVCPNGLMFVNGSICNICVQKTIPYPVIYKKCYRDSYAASTVTATMLSIHNLLNTWKSKIDGLICISEFVKKQLVAGNFDQNQLHLKYNFVSTDTQPNFTPGEYYIYAGRLSTEKGIDILLDSFKTNQKKIIIIGDGPLKESVLKATETHANILYYGKLPLKETYELLATAKALIFPSKWHEPFGRTIVESFAHGTPVIGAALGGVTELIKDGYNGFLFDPHKKSDLEQAINKLENHQELQSLRQNAYSSYQNNFTESISFIKTIEIYNKVLASQSI